MIKSKSDRAIAEKIYEIEHANWKQKREWHLTGVKKWHVEIRKVLDTSTSDIIWIDETVTIEQSKDMFSWHIWDKSSLKNGAFLKVVPASDLEIDAIERILNAQPWFYI